jgi:hypothetical protein
MYRASRIGIFGLSEADLRRRDALQGDHPAFSLGNYEVTLHDIAYDWAQHVACWRPRYADLWGFAFVIDASNRGHFLQSVALLPEVRRDRPMTGKPCFVFLNKSDLADPTTVGDANRFTEMAYDVHCVYGARARFEKTAMRDPLTAVLRRFSPEKTAMRDPFMKFVLPD